MKKIINYLLIYLLLTSCVRNMSDEELESAYRVNSGNSNWTEALKYVNEGIRRKPSDTALYFSKALCLKHIDPKKNNSEIIQNLNVFLKKYTNSVSGRILKFANHYDNYQYEDAISEIEQLERYYGISARTLELKADARFLGENFKEAVKTYEKLLFFPLPEQKFLDIYYYKIYSKYFAGNKKGALWDVAFLEDYGYEEDKELLKRITNDSLKIEDYNKLPFVTNTQKFTKEITPILGLSYDALFRPVDQLNIYSSPNYTLKDLKTLDKDITILNLNRANISELPDDIKRFKKLRVLSLSRNKIRDFDKLFTQLSELPKLEFLSLDYSNLKKFPGSISKLSQLKGLSIEACNIRELPREIAYLSNLSFLNVGSNGRLKDLPAEIKYLKKLNCLDVSGSGMQRLREELSLCYSLVAIHGNASKIKSIPTTIGNLKLLRHLNLAHNKLEFLPESIGKLMYLKDLSLGSNDIKDLPKSIVKLKNLEHLGLQLNRFKAFPEKVLQLDNLSNLWLHNNSIPTIPIEIGEMKSIKRLLVDHEVITDKNIEQIKVKYPNLHINRHDALKLVGGKRRK